MWGDGTSQQASCLIKGLDPRNSLLPMAIGVVPEMGVDNVQLESFNSRNKQSLRRVFPLVGEGNNVPSLDGCLGSCLTAPIRCFTL